MRVERFQSPGSTRIICATTGYGVGRLLLSWPPWPHVLRYVPLWCLVVVLAYLGTGCTSDAPASAQHKQAREAPGAPKPVKEDPGAPTSVKVARVQQVPMERMVTALGSLAAYEQATVSVKAPGRVQSIGVDLGSTVKRGQILAQIEAQDYHLRVQQAEAALVQARVRLGLAPGQNGARLDLERTSTVKQARAVLDEAKANHERSLTLHQQGVLAQAQLGSAEAAYKVAQSRYEDALEEVRNRQALLGQRQSELDLARQQFTDTTIAAPFDGAIQERRANVGEYLAAGAPIATIVRMDPVRLRVDVPEREASSVRVGQKVRVAVEGDTTLYTGRIARLSPTITPQSRMLLVEAEVSNPGTLRPGSFAHADIIVDANNPAVAVPANAIVTFAGVEKVLIVHSGKTVEKTIITRRRTGDWVEVASGVNVGDVVVINPGNLQSGQAVTVME